jgi:hypothetical protein
VIASGIEAERAGLKAQMRKDLQLGYEQYPLMMALSDAATYHSRCNAISGLAYLQAAASNAKSSAETGNKAGDETPPSGGQTAAAKPSAS